MKKMNKKKDKKSHKDDQSSAVSNSQVSIDLAAMKSINE